MRHPDDGIHWRPNLVTHIRKEFRFDSRGFFRHFLGSQDLRFCTNTFRYIAEGHNRTHDFVPL